MAGDLAQLPDVLQGERAVLARNDRSKRPVVAGTVSAEEISRELGLAGSAPAVLRDAAGRTPWSNSNG